MKHCYTGRGRLPSISIVKFSVKCGVQLVRQYVRNWHLLTPTLYVMFHSVSYRAFINNFVNNSDLAKTTVKNAGMSNHKGL